MYDGKIDVYRFADVHRSTPRVIYVNGIQTTPTIHRATAEALSQITQRVVTGVYNKTHQQGTLRGTTVDLLQCVGDWAIGFSNQIGEFGFDAVNYAVDKVRSWTGVSSRSPADMANELRRRIPSRRLESFLGGYLATTNKASSALFALLNDRVGSQQLIVAHSQGNLITANALWALQTLHGARGLQNIRIYSIASPVPAWPAGTNHRIKVYGHTNDLVTRADPKNWPVINRRSPGDWRSYSDPIHQGNATREQARADNRDWKPHDIAVNFFGTNFVSRIRSDLNLGAWRDSQGEPQPYRPGDAVHVVNAGESLSSIAKQYKGSALLWNELYAENRDLIGPDPNRIEVGQQLRLPKGWRQD